MRIAVAMSGGVDSSVTAALLRAEGHDVTGLTMRLFPCPLAEAAPPGEAAAVTSAEATAAGAAGFGADARAVCAALGLEHHVVELGEPFTREIIEPFVAEYLRARTPNPCICCNARMKAGLLLAKARELGCEVLATGHYARLDADPATGLKRLRTALDPERDQSYFLFAIPQESLRQMCFPLGEKTKTEVRRMAAELKLPVAEKPDSQEICFIPDNDHRRFLRARAPHAFRPGPILFEDGRGVGRHQGLAGHTIGQRRGLRVAWREPLYVVALDPERNAIILGPEKSLWAAGLTARGAHWIAGAPPGASFRAEAKIRSRNPPKPCTVRAREDGVTEVAFDTPVRAVAPGQAVVFYAGDVVLGGAWIEEAKPLSNLVIESLSH